MKNVFQAIVLIARAGALTAASLALFLAPIGGPFQGRLYAQYPSATNYSVFAQAFALPAVTPLSTTSSQAYTAGTITVGTTNTSIVAGNVTLSGGALNNCTPPAYSSCGFVYWPGSGTSLSFTTNYATAATPGNVIIAFLTSNSSNIPLVITPWTLNAVIAPGYPGEVYSTAPAAGTSSIGATTIVTTTVAGTYRLSWYLTQTALGTSCTGNTTVVVNAIYQDPNAASAQTVALATHTVTTNGTLGQIPWTSGPISWTFRAKAATNVQFSTTYTLGTACSPGPSVQIFPVLEAL